MGFFERFNKRANEVQTEPVVDDVLLKALIQGEPITREKALMLPAVSAAVDYIGNCVACMPIQLYKQKQGKVEPIENDNRIRLLNGDTNDTLDAFQLKKAMVEDYLLGKGGYCYIRKNRNNVTGLYYVKDINISIMTNNEPIFKDYTIMAGANSYKPYEFLKLLRNTKDGASGTGVTAEVSKALETAYQTMLMQLGLVKKGGGKKGFLKAQRKLAQEEIDVLKNAWNNMYANNSDNVIVLNNGLEFQEAAASSVELQLNESKQTLDAQINNIFHLNGDFYQTFKEAIYPILKAFETALNRDLLLEKEKKTHFFEFDTKEILKASVVERYNAYKTAKDTGFMTINEIRKAENMNYVEGLDVVNVGLSAVLYDINTHKYYTPNTDTTGTTQETEDEQEDQEIENRYNENHDSKTGRFGSGKAVDKSTSTAENNGASAKGANELEHKGFRNKQKLNNHWKNGRTHNAEYVADGIVTAKQYEDRAVELAQKAVDGKKILGYKTKNKWQICRYDTEKNDYVKADVKKGVITMFKPDEGKNYFYKMEKKESDG